MEGIGQGDESTEPVLTGLGMGDLVEGIGVFCQLWPCIFLSGFLFLCVLVFHGIWGFGTVGGFWVLYHSLIVIFSSAFFLFWRQSNCGAVYLVF